MIPIFPGCVVNINYTSDGKTLNIMTSHLVSDGKTIILHPALSDDGKTINIPISDEITLTFPSTDDKTVILKPEHISSGLWSLDPGCRKIDEVVIMPTEYLQNNINVGDQVNIHPETTLPYIPVSKQGLYPIQDHLPFRYYKELQRSTWFAEDFPIDNDKLHLTRLNSYQSQILKKILAILYFSDNSIIQSISRKVVDNVLSIEEQTYFTAQIYNESIHAEMYSQIAYSFYGGDWGSFQNMLDNTFVSEKESMLRNLLNSESGFSSLLKDGGESGKYFLDSIHPYGMFLDSIYPDELLKKLEILDMRIILSFVEGVSLMTTFCIILWFSTLGLFPVLVQINGTIQNDEAIHRNYHIERVLEILDSLGIKLNNVQNDNNLRKDEIRGLNNNISQNDRDKVEIKSKISSVLRSRILDISKTVLNMELLQLDYLYSTNIGEHSTNSTQPGIPTKDSVREYICYLNDYILNEYLGSGVHHQIPDWLESLSVERKNNFFEIKSSIYNNKEINSLKYEIGAF